MTEKSDSSEQQLPVFMIVDGELVRKAGDLRDPKKRYSSVSGPDGAYLREFTDDEERQRDEEEARWAAEAPLRALEEEQRRAKVDAFRDSLKYAVRLVAFVDILGWSKAVEASASDPTRTQKLGLALNTIRCLTQQSEWMVQHGGHDGWPGNLQVTHFSDCLTISAQPDYAGKTQLISALGFLSTSLLQQGFLLRGGITEGELYHQESMVFGPALLKAYELESRCSVYPRIVLDPLLAERWGQGNAYREKNGSLIGYARTWRASHDGFRFFDFLQPFEGCPTFWGNSDLVRLTLRPLRSLLVESLKTHAGNTSVWPKYVWLANYFNEVCIEYEGHGIEPIQLPS